ncbi:MAG: metallophosphoesterase [Myxococcota bacterium]
MSLLRRTVLRHGILTLLGILGISQALTVQWGLLALGRGGVGVPSALLAVFAIAALNLGVLLLLRALSRRRPLVFAASRLYMVTTIGSLVAAPLLAIAFLAGSLPALAGQPDAARWTILSLGTLALTLGHGSIAWGALVGRHRVTVDQVAIPMRPLPQALEALRCIQISDLHIGPQLRAPRLRVLVEQVNEVEGDLIVVTGDLFDFDPAFIEEGCRELAELSAPLGVYAILGNHDAYTGREAVAAGLRRWTSIRLLRDEWIPIEAYGERLILLGHEDPGEGWSDRDCESPALEKLCRDAPAAWPRILLSHRPAFFGQAARLGIPLMLSGHTHGGQISLPGRLRHHNVARLISHWTRGRFERGPSTLYVNRGLGVGGPPVRVNCPPEISRIRLVQG